MKRHYHWFRVFMAGASLGAVHCERQQDWTALETNCYNYCTLLWAKDDGYSSCRVECEERMDDALDISDECGEAYGGLMQCLGDGTSDDVEAFEDYHDNGDTQDYLCEPQTEQFKVECPGFWFLDPGFKRF